MKVTDERVSFMDIPIGASYAIGRGRNQKIYHKVGRFRYVQQYHATEGIKTMNDHNRLVYVVEDTEKP